MSRCPHCGRIVTEPIAVAMLAEAAGGFTAGRYGDPCEVPSMYEKSPSEAGLWKHGWNLGDAVRKQVEDPE